MVLLSKYIAILVKFGRKSSKAKIGICCSVRGRVNEMNNDQSNLGVEIERIIGESLTASTSSYAGDIRSVFHGVDTSLLLRSVLAGLLFRNGNADVETEVRSVNSSVVEHVHSSNSVTKGRTLNCFPESRREEIDLIDWLTISHIAWTLIIDDELTKSMTHRKLLLLLTKTISQTASAKSMGVLRGGYHADNQYLDFTGTHRDREYLGEFPRRRDGSGSQKMMEKVSLFLINCITKDQNTE